MNNPIHSLPPLTESQMQASIDATNHAIVTSYIEAALTVQGLRPEVRHHLEQALLIHKI